MRDWVIAATVCLGILLGLWTYFSLTENLPLPRLVANMTGDFYGDDPEFQRRVAAAYPSPVSLAALTKDLSDQGYILNGQTAVYSERFLGCRDVRTVSWRVEGYQASQIQGRFDHLCP